MRLFKLMSTAFSQFDNTVENFLTKAFNSMGLQYNRSQIFEIIFTGIKGVMENAVFYIEDAFTEQNIKTAVRKRSVYALAQLSGYEPYYGSAPSGTILVKSAVDSGSGLSKIYLTNHMRITNRNTGYTYTIILPGDNYIIDLSKPLLTHEFKIVQGQYTAASYSAVGTAYETVHVSSNDLFDINYITVTVDGEEWSPAACLYDMDENGKQYIIKTGADNTFDVMFGTGVYGKILEEGQTVVVRYLQHSGSAGNIQPNTVSTMLFVDYASDSTGNNINPNDSLIIGVSGAVTGGTDADSVEFVRNMAGYNSRSLVMASEDNFRLFFRRFSFIGYSNCWSETNSMVVTASCLKNVDDLLSSDVTNYYSLSDSDILLSDEEKNMVIKTLDNSKRAFAGVTLKFQDPVIRKFALICYIKPDNVYNKQAIQDSVSSTVATMFSGMQDIEQFVAKSDIIKNILDDCEYIKAIDIDIISDLAEQTYYNGYYDKYILKYDNGSYEYRQQQIIYEPSSAPGLDIYGNISLDSKLEIPFISKGFRYYPNKTDNDKTDSIVINEPVQVVFI